MHEPLPSDPAPDAAPDAADERPRGITIDDLSPRLRAATVRTGWPALTPVQSEAIPLLLDGRNVMVQARTGSGKTGAFLLPMLERLDASEDGCQALILVPTRELARQVWQQAEVIFADTPLRTVAVYGGVGYGPQTDALRGGAHIVVGTPGRVLDHLLKRNFRLDDLRMLIFDEADRMLSMGFYPDMRQVQRYLPKRPVHGCMFSATFPAAVLRTAEQFIKDPEFISLSQDHVHVTDIEHVYYNIPGTDKDRSLVRIIEIENPASALIFCNTKSKVHYVSVVLRRFGYDADELSADLSQADRERVLERVTSGKLRFLVATDVAGRGIDIPDLSHVIQYEPPEDPESYVHRAGRTGRAGAGGVAINLVYAMESLALARIAARWEIDMEERPLPTDADVEAVVTERLTALLEARLRERDKLQTERSRRFIALGRSLAESEDELPIIAMLLDDMYQQLMHAPADGGAATSESKSRRTPEREARPRRESRPERERSEPRRSEPPRSERPDRADGERVADGASRDSRGDGEPRRSSDVAAPTPVEEAPRRPASSYYRTAPGGPSGGWRQTGNEAGGTTEPASAGDVAAPNGEAPRGGAPRRDEPRAETPRGEDRGPAPRRRRRRGGAGTGGGAGGGDAQ